MKKTLYAVILLVTVWADGGAHDYWISAGVYNPLPGTEVSVDICGGHYFPKSSFAVSEKLVNRLEVTAPDGGGRMLLTAESEDGKKRSGSCVFESTGTYLVQCRLKKPGASEISAWLKAIVISGEDVPGQYYSGSGLEIVPGEMISKLGKKDILPVNVYLDGRKIRSAVTVYPEKGRKRRYNTATNIPAKVKIRKPGRYLLTASYKGASCSLTFEVIEIE